VSQLLVCQWLLAGFVVYWVFNSSRVERGWELLMIVLWPVTLALAAFIVLDQRRRKR
jgi:hypothetical protein